MAEPNEPQKAGRVKVSFYLPDFKHAQILQRLGIADVKDGQITTGAVSSLAKLFLLHFASGKAGLDFTFEPKPEELKKVA